MAKKMGKPIAKKSFFTKKRVILAVIFLFVLPSVLFGIATSYYIASVKIADRKLEKAAGEYINIPKGWEDEGVTLCGVNGCGIAIKNYSESKFSIKRSLNPLERRDAIKSFSELNGNFEIQKEQLNCGQDLQKYSDGCFRIFGNSKHKATIEVYGSSGRTFVTVRIEKDVN